MLKPIYVYVSDIFAQGAGRIERMGDPRLRELAKKVPETAMASREEGTVKTYSYGFRRWKKWAQKFEEVDYFPAKPEHVALYLISIMQNSTGPGPILTACYAIQWAHNMAGLDSPTQDHTVKAIVEAAKRKLGKAVTKKEPLSPADIRKIVDIKAGTKANLMQLRAATICTISYAGFLRFSDLVRIKRSHLEFHETHMRIFLEKAKNDVYREGKWVTIAKTGEKTCPCSILIRFLTAAGMLKISNKFLFRGCTFYKSSDTYRLRAGNVALSYTSVREMVKDVVEEIGLDPKKFGTHSLRSGGATRAAEKGIPDRLFKSHGRWRSDKAKNGYVKESLRNKLKVTKALGI